MSRQSISLTTPNSEWLKKKIEVEGEYKSNSELINELIRQERARERDHTEFAVIRQALENGDEGKLVSSRSTADTIAAALKRKTHL